MYMFLLSRISDEIFDSNPLRTTKKQKPPKSNDFGGFFMFWKIECYLCEISKRPNLLK